MIYNSNSVKETQNIAKALAKNLLPGDVICLRGDLGVGKTVFVQGLAEGLQIKETITSPTFTIVNCSESGRLPFYHFDVYRMDDSDEMYEIGYEEYVYGEGVSVIEWPDKIADILPQKRYDIEISKDLAVHEDYRIINIEKRA